MTKRREDDTALKHTEEQGRVTDPPGSSAHLRAGIWRKSNFNQSAARQASVSSFGFINEDSEHFLKLNNTFGNSQVTSTPPFGLFPDHSDHLELVLAVKQPKIR